MTVPSNSSPPALRVALLHNYRDEQQPSMRLYAERLGQALTRRSVSVRRVRPPGLVPDGWRARSKLWAKVDAYGGRFVVYPRLLRTLSADLFHVVDHGQGYLADGLDPRRTVVTCHDVVLLALATGRIGGAKVPTLALGLLRLSLTLMKRAARVVADSHQTRRDLVSLVGIDPAKITVVYPGLNQPFVRDPARGEALRRQFGLGVGQLMLQVGTIFYKNIAGCLRVLQRLRRDGVDVRMVRIGRALEGADRALAERLGVGGHVVELGHLPDTELPALYNAADLLLFPSLYEGFGWPPLEAMASGTAVVCSRAGSLDEVVADAALTADAEDVDALAWHAGAVLTDPVLRAKVVERGIARAAEFNWDRAAAQMVDVYRDVVANAA